MHKQGSLALSLILSLILPGSVCAAQTVSTVELVAFSKENQTVKDLSPGDFELRMDGKTVAVESLKFEPKEPPRMILLVDTSYTALNNRPLLKDIVTAFIDAKPKQMEMALATINDVQQFLSPYQKSNDELVSTLQKMKFGGSPFLSQSILGALNYFDSTSTPLKNRRHVVVTISDGVDNSPNHLWNQVQKIFHDNGMAYYEINHIRVMKAIFDYKFSDKDLVRLTEETGGRSFRLTDFGDITAVAREIYDREINTYHASISSDTRISGGDRNRFKVKSHRKDVRIEVVAVH